MITKEDFAKLQKLSKLSFSEEEMPVIIEKLNNVMSMIDEITKVDCSNVEPLRSVCDMNQRLREDRVTTQDISDQLLSNIPQQGRELAKAVKCFIVPKVVE